MYKAIKDRVIVRLSDSPQSGQLISLQDNLRDRGIIIDIGAAVKDLHIGDEVVFHIFDELPLPEKNLVVVREKSILGILTTN